VTVFADGFIAYHLEVSVRRGLASDVARTIKDWKPLYREQGTWPGFPQTMIDQLNGLPGVENVVCEGPQSSLLIPLRMIRGIAGVECHMSTVLGAGAVTDAIYERFAQWGIVISGRRLEGFDSPIEISVREPGGQHESVRLYPASRNRYRSQLAKPETPPEQFLCNRYNKGIAALADTVATNGGLVSFRPRELGRHDRIEDSVSLLASTHHLILSSRHRIMKQFAQFADIETQTGWPVATEDLSSSAARSLARWLLDRMPPEAIVVFIRHPENETAFFCDGREPVFLPAPVGYGPESRAARIQGALLGEVMRRNGAQSLCHDQSASDAGTRSIVDAAFRGTESRPWHY